MGNISEKKASMSVGIVGSPTPAGDGEEHRATVVQEDSVNKLLVKSTTVPQTALQLIFDEFTNAGSAEMAINGSTVNQTFTVVADATKNKIIREIRFNGYDNGIKIDNFMAFNNPLSVGILVRITVNGLVQEFLPIKSTADFDGHFAFGAGARFSVITASGNDYMSAVFSPDEPTVLKAGSGDKLEIVIRDNLNTVSSLSAIAFGLFDI